jgi:ATP synthase protein I
MTQEQKDANRNQLRKNVVREAKRMNQAEKERATLLAQSIYVGTLGLLLVLPVVAGAYLGRWLDERFAGYSIRWTISLIVLGLGIGAVNVYLFIRE